MKNRCPNCGSESLESGVEEREAPPHVALAPTRSLVTRCRDCGWSDAQIVPWKEDKTCPRCGATSPARVETAATKEGYLWRCACGNEYPPRWT
jgi:predicted nucleic-acid-binding Zn-ribbon protein